MQSGLIPLPWGGHAQSQGMPATQEAPEALKSSVSHTAYLAGTCAPGDRESKISSLFLLSHLAIWPGLSIVAFCLSGCLSQSSGPLRILWA